MSVCGVACWFVHVCECVCQGMQVWHEKHHRHLRHGRSPSNFQPPDKLFISVLHSKAFRVGKQVMNVVVFCFFLKLLKHNFLSEND